MHRLNNLFVIGKTRSSLRGDDMDPSYDQAGEFFTTVDGVPVRKLFVGNLPEGAAYDIGPVYSLLNTIFSSYGNIKEVKVITKNPKPFAFVTYTTPQDAAKAFNKRGSLFLHRKKLYLSFADSWHQPLDLPNGEVCWDRRKAEAESQEAEQSDGQGEDPPEAEESSICMDEAKESERQEDKEDDDVLMKDCPIDRLNDDCLQLIFDMLPAPDRLTLSRVCRRWRIMNSFFWQSFKKLDFTAPPFDKVVLTDTKLKYFLLHCPNVTSLNIAQDDNDLTSDAIVIIAKKCKHLEEIHMRNITIKRRSLAYLANSCPKLKTFSMDACNSHHDGEMISLVKKSKNLESINLKYGNKTSGMWLKHIQDPLRSLMLEMYEFNSEYLLEGIARARSTLRELTFVSCSKLRNQDLEKIVALCPELTRFALSGMIQLYDNRALQPITKLSQLEYLDLEHNRVVNDKFIASLVEGCPKLKQLNLSGIESFELTERGLTRLVELTELTHLRMACIKVTDSLLKLLSKKLKLKHLDIMGCSNVTDEGCIEILNNCQQLESLDLAGCVKVTNETILAAVNILSNDLSRKKLNIVCGSTRVMEEPWFHDNDAMKRLNVDLKSTYISNFFDEIYQMDSDLDGSDGSFDDYDVYDEYNPYHHNYFGVDSDYDFDPDYDLFDMIHNNFEFYVGEDEDDNYDLN